MLIEPLIQSCDLAFLKTGYSLVLAGVTTVLEFGLGGDEMLDAIKPGDGFSDKAVGGRNDHQGIADGSMFFDQSAGSR